MKTVTWTRITGHRGDGAQRGSELMSLQGQMVTLLSKTANTAERNLFKDLTP